MAHVEHGTAKEEEMQRKLFYIGVFAVAAIAIAGVSYAAIPSSGGVISACKAKDGGIKLIDKEAGQNCSASQQLVEWNKQGQSGVSGYEEVAASTATNSAGDKTLFANCPAGKKIVGGGAGVYGEWTAQGQILVDGVGLIMDHPFNDTGWVAKAEEFVPTANGWYLFIKIVCADVS
jgi:hypothetical protein